MKSTASETWINMPVYEFDGIFYKRFISGTSHSCRHNDTAIMFGKGRKVLIYYRLHFVGAIDRRLQIIGNDDHWSTAIKT